MRGGRADGKKNSHRPESLAPGLITNRRPVKVTEGKTKSRLCSVQHDDNFPKVDHTLGDFITIVQTQTAMDSGSFNFVLLKKKVLKIKLIF